MSDDQATSVAVVEAALRVKNAGPGWLEPVVERFEAAWPGCLGTFALEWEMSNDLKALETVHEAHRGVSHITTPAMDGMLSMAQRQNLYGQSAQCTLASELFQGQVPETIRSVWHSVGMVDGVGLVAGVGAGRRPDHFAGVLLAGALPTSTNMSPRARSRWVSVGHQLALAARLHRLLENDALDTLPHARFTPAGRCLDARGDTTHRTMRDALSLLVRGLEDARAGALRGHVDEALSMWERLASGEWILVDQLESDGQRHVVAMPCPAAGSIRALSEQQRAIAQAAGEGMTSPDIAKRMGIEERVVAMQLTRALSKLGLPNRMSLVRLWSTLERAGHTR